MEPDDDRTQSHTVLTEGTRVGRYRVEKKIGAGGMGEVYLAEDTELDRKVALKFLPSHLCSDEDCRRRFKREAQAAAKLSHPNIIHVYEVSEYQGRPFFAMEHVEGRSLRDVKSEELDIDRIIGIAIQLCDGLHTAHAAGVTHRDIKPSNIIIDSNGRPKLLDFGLAAVKGGEHLTKTGSTFGTVGYMSPEQIEGKATDARSDLFSLGIVLYELIANKSPFRRDDETATLKAILQDTPEPLARYKAGVPDDFQRIVSKLLEKDPALRYQSASGVIPDFKRLSAPQSSFVKTEKKRDWWNRYVVPLAVVFLLAVLMVWYFGYRDRTPKTSGADDRIMLAVLPFENLGDPEDEYFADGMTEEITSRLGMISKLGVIARTSTMRYKNTKKDIAQIASELGVDYILEGSVRWDKTSDTDFVRITPQLIRVTDRTHLWASNYERPLTRIFTVQADIAMRIANALDINLLSSEHENLDRIPTDNLEAYHAYLKAEDIFWRMRITEEDYKKAADLYRKAIKLDSAFAAAYTGLARYHILAEFMLFDQDRDHRTLAKQALDRAIEIDPNLAEAHFALAWYYNNLVDDITRSIAELELAIELKPNYAEAYSLLGSLMLFMGDLDNARRITEKAYYLDPRSPIATISLSEVYVTLDRFADADRLYDRLLQTDSTNVIIYLARARLYLLWKGDISLAKKILQDLPEEMTKDPLFQYFQVHLDFLDRRIEDALNRFPEGIPLVVVDSAEYYIQKGELLFYSGNVEKSREYFDSLLLVVEGRFRNKDEVRKTQLGMNRAWAYAGLGRKEEAVREAERVLKEAEASGRISRWISIAFSNIRMYLMIGEYEKALDLLEKLLATPNDVISVAHVRIDPRWDSLRDHPRFKALIEKYEKERSI